MTKIESTVMSKVETRLVLDFFDAVLVSYSICCNRHFVSTYGKMEKMQIVLQRNIQNQCRFLVRPETIHLCQNI